MANKILAAIFSFFIPGLGQFYAGSLSRAYDVCNIPCSSIIRLRLT